MYQCFQGGVLQVQKFVSKAEKTDTNFDVKEMELYELDLTMGIWWIGQITEVLVPTKDFSNLFPEILNHIQSISNLSECKQ